MGESGLGHTLLSHCPLPPPNPTPSGLKGRREMLFKQQAPRKATRCKGGQQGPQGWNRGVSWAVCGARKRARGEPARATCQRDHVYDPARPTGSFSGPHTPKGCRAVQGCVWGGLSQEQDGAGSPPAAAGRGVTGCPWPEKAEFSGCWREPVSFNSQRGLRGSAPGVSFSSSKGLAREGPAPTREGLPQNRCAGLAFRPVLVALN